MEEEHETNRSLRRKKSSVVGNITCCFNGSSTQGQGQHRRRASFDGNVSFTVSSWFKSKTNDLPEIKGRCRSFISRVGRCRRHSSADFTYDPLSYSLNFDRDESSSSKQHAAMDFNARLPVTPPKRTVTPPPFQEINRKLPQSPAPERNDDLRRGFEALSVSLKASPVRPGQMRNNNSNTDQEDITPAMTPLSSPSNRGVLVQLC